MYVAPGLRALAAVAPEHRERLDIDGARRDGHVAGDHDRGDPGGRWNPRDLSALAAASMPTLRLGDASTRPRTTDTSSS